MKLDFDILSKIDFEEIWINADFGEINLYFIGPKEAINDIYPEAEHFTIHLELVSRTAMISPTKAGEDYDWSPLELDSDAIDRLIAIAALRSNVNAQKENEDKIIKMAAERLADRLSRTEKAKKIKEERNAEN